MFNPSVLELEGYSFGKLKNTIIFYENVIYLY